MTVEADASIVLTTGWAPYIIMVLHSLIHFILPPAFQSGYYYHPHFTDEKAEAGRQEVTHPRSHDRA